MGIKAVFGANLKYYRKKRRLSQEQLAEKADITPKHLSAIETGTAFISADLLEKLTQILKISASTLFYSAEENPVDDNFYYIVDKIVEKELLKSMELIKIQIRHAESTLRDSNNETGSDKNYVS
jgi:transcriptional regulator with XRE-family HTH domain